ncbi:MAG TPA: hypothetical protein VFV71_03415 [Burkholderiales bacterium]|nr:hypothetical protein [Burkholderiales bacterium]
MDARIFQSVCLKTAALTLFFALLLAGSPMSFAAETTAKDIGRKMDETGQAIKDYSVERRDEALKSAKQVLADADERIDRFEADVNRKWDRMSASARRQAQETLRTMRRQRQDLSESYGELKRSSSGAWEEVKGGFAKSYGALRDSFSKAAKEF